MYLLWYIQTQNIPQNYNSNYLSVFYASLFDIIARSANGQRTVSKWSANQLTVPESKNRRPHLSLCDIILRLKRGKRGSCSYFWTSFKPPDLTYVCFRLKRFKWGHTLRREKCLWGSSRSKRFLSVKGGWKIKYRG